MVPIALLPIGFYGDRADGNDGCHLLNIRGGLMEDRRFDTFPVQHQAHSRPSLERANPKLPINTKYPVPLPDKYCDLCASAACKQLGTTARDLWSLHGIDWRLSAIDVIISLHAASPPC